MARLEKTDKRTHYCGTLRRADIDKTVCVMGWTARARDLGGLVFIDLRDRTGIVQLAFDDNTDRAVFEEAVKTRSEYVVVAHGTVRERSAINTQIPTGEIEIAVTEYKILSAAETTPFEINDSVNVRDETALKYRYLDLRRAAVRRNLELRHRMAFEIRR